MGRLNSHAKYKQTQKEDIPDSKKWAVNFQHQIIAKFGSRNEYFEGLVMLSSILPYGKSFASPEVKIQSFNSRFLYSTITISKLSCLNPVNQMDKMSLPNPNHDTSPSPDHSSSPTPFPPEKAHLTASPDKRSIPIRMFDSFRRDPDQKITETGEMIDLKLGHGHDESYDIESAITNIAKSPLSRKLEARHLQMIAIGGAIGMRCRLSSHLNHVLLLKGKV